MKTCVIGGGGFIGKYLVEELINTGREVIVLGRQSVPKFSLHPKAQYAQCDYLERDLLRPHLQASEEVIDLAYSTVPQTSFQDPIFDLQSNLPRCVGLMEEVTKLPHIKTLLFTSSGGTVYGDATSLPITEDAVTAPVSPYGITKLTVERYLLMYHKLRGLPAVIVRPSNAYGVGQKPFTGQGFIATAMGMVLQNNPITLFGENGTVRDYIHVQDTASGILAALDCGHHGEVYNLGSGVGRNNREIIEAISQISSHSSQSVTIDVQPKRGFDVEANVLNFGKLLACSGWLPKVSFEDGLSEMWQHLSAN